MPDRLQWRSGEGDDLKNRIMFTEPSREEMDDVQRRTRDIKTIEEMRATLGEPDEVVNLPGIAEMRAALRLPDENARERFACQFIYRRPWKTLDVFVCTSREQIKFLIRGKRKGGGTARHELPKN